jgi:beta-galactosidase
MHRLNRNSKTFILLCVFVSVWCNSLAQRQDISLNKDWLTITTDQSGVSSVLAITPSIVEMDWKRVNIPHNWDSYEGYQRLLHGNRHGNAWYRKAFSIKQAKAKKRFFLFFEGVGSYASVYLNGKYAGEHAGGRTTFTLDVTNVIKTDGTNNLLTVAASHPANIKDLPWVCGGCSDERGFSEGSQPMGIFRPVHLIITNDVRIEPFGVHAWADIKDHKANLNIVSTIRNYSAQTRTIAITQQLKNKMGLVISTVSQKQTLQPLASLELPQVLNNLKPVLWTIDNPYLYEIVTTITEDAVIIDRTTTDFGFRTINWKTPANQFFLNDKPVFINGIAEYEHLLGQSHAFSNEQIISRMKWVKAAGFNAFRDAHQPHNLLYGQLCNEMGILWWTQLSAHIWYDTPEFRKNFKQLLKEWVIERRNDPSVILWGLQNESKLPEDFAKECTELIRSLDPTSSSQRLVTTCNGGSGTDWDVPQNWTGTYGGDPATYAADIKKQVLIGEYGAWRTIDLHTEGGFIQNGILSEDRMVQLMEQKVRLAESVKDSCTGQFFWLLTSHDNPGRVQGGEGLRELDRVGPVNYKGLLTPWEEPTDAFYMFRSNYAPKETEPMVYIVSHTWPNRWMTPGIKDKIIVYSNCDEVELFNDINSSSLGKRKRNGIGTHFEWDSLNIQYNLLYAVGYVNGKAMARDTVVLFHLPESPSFSKLYASAKNITKPQTGYNYLYRVNCGGPEYTDENGSRWREDKGLAKSWANDFPGIPPNFASQRRTFAPIKNTRDWKLFQTFRYGKDKLKYEFSLPHADYSVELFFAEPWLGTGGGFNAKGMRLFDVAINNKTILSDLDIWSEVGSNTVFKKTVRAKSVNGKIIISFPESKAGQAIISAIAIAILNEAIPAPPQPLPGMALFDDYRKTSWLDIGDKLYADENIVFNSLPSNLYGAEWFCFKSAGTKTQFPYTTESEIDFFVGVKKGSDLPVAIKDFENTQTEITTDEKGGTYYAVFRKRLRKGSVIDFNDLPGCIAMMNTVTNMQPAYDLKPLTAYRTNVAIVSEDVNKETFATRESAVVKSSSAITIQWPVQTGVADIYSITVKYSWPAEKPINGRIQLVDAGNTMMLDLPVEFTFTRPGKWNQFTVNTGNMINAGNYTVKLITSSAQGLAVSGIEIQ